MNRKGIARTLVQKVIEWASEPSLPNACVFLHVIGYNQAAREFYSKIGFTELRIRQGRLFCFNLPFFLRDPLL